MYDERPLKPTVALWRIERAGENETEWPSDRGRNGLALLTRCVDLLRDEQEILDSFLAAAPEHELDALLAGPGPVTPGDAAW